MANGGRITKKNLDKFLSLLREGYSVRSAVRGARISSSGVYKKRDQDPEFRAAWQDALDEGTGLYEDEMKNRVFEGEPILGREGEIVGFKKSDRLLEFALRSRDPETYAEKRKTELTGANGGPLETSNTTEIALTPEARQQRIRDLREALGKRETSEDD